MSCRVIADPGSTHLGNIDRAMETTKAVADAGAWSIKWQLFKACDIPQPTNNIPLPYEWFSDLVGYGMELGLEVFGSVWSDAGIRLLAASGAKSVKLSYGSVVSKSPSIELLRHDLKHAILWDNIFLSCNVNTVDSLRSVYPDCTKLLYCIPEYPVSYIVDFEGLFPRFDGFSSHCNGIMQDIEAIRNGAMFIEKHVQLDGKSKIVPDGAFAINPAQLERLCNAAKE